MKRTAFIFILGAVCLVVGSSTFWIGRDRALKASASHAGTADRGASPTSPPVEPVESRPPSELALLKEKLGLSYTTCPSAQYDWTLRGQTAAVLSTMTKAELRSLLDELVARLNKMTRVSIDDPNKILALDVL
ncbi:MAG TPA: hypothetical protein VGE67_04140, partial [Haloferula sp.]